MTLPVELDAGPLRAASDEAVIAWLADALARLADEAERGVLGPTELGSPLSAPALADAIVTAARVRDELAAAARMLEGRRPVGRVAMVLPSNVETAVVRPLVWALLARNEVLLRPSSRRAGVAPRLLELLGAGSPGLARCLSIVSSQREDLDAHRGLATRADRVHAWGADPSLDELEASVGVPIVRHGTGLSIAIVSREASTRLRDLDALDALALDVARYDQRGCLSPHAVLVEDGGAVAADQVAESLDRALGALERRLPRGALLPHELAAERLWRDTAHAMGVPLRLGSSHAVSLERGAVRSCPGARNIAVHALPRPAIASLAARLGAQLKCVGALDAADVASIEGWLDAPAHVVPFGTMQTPGLLAPADGRAPWTDLVAEP